MIHPGRRSFIFLSISLVGAFLSSSFQVHSASATDPPNAPSFSVLWPNGTVDNPSIWDPRYSFYMKVSVDENAINTASARLSIHDPSGACVGSWQYQDWDEINARERNMTVWFTENQAWDERLIWTHGVYRFEWYIEDEAGNGRSENTYAGVPIETWPVDSQSEWSYATYSATNIEVSGGQIYVPDFNTGVWWSIIHPWEQEMRMREIIIDCSGIGGGRSVNCWVQCPVGTDSDTINASNGKQTYNLESQNMISDESRIRFQLWKPLLGSSPYVLSYILVAEEFTPPPKPSLISPFDGQTVKVPSITFEWSSVYDPSGVVYELQVDNDPNFTSPELDEIGITDNNFTRNLREAEFADGMYYWRVCAEDGAGNRNWSDNSGFLFYPKVESYYAGFFLTDVIIINTYTFYDSENTPDDVDFFMKAENGENISPLEVIKEDNMWKAKFDMGSLGARPMLYARVQRGGLIENLYMLIDVIRTPEWLKSLLKENEIVDTHYDNKVYWEMPLDGELIGWLENFEEGRGVKELLEGDETIVVPEEVSGGGLSALS